MRVILAIDKAKDAARRHRAAYPDPLYRFYDGSTAGAKQAELDALKEPTVAAVEKILNNSWTQTICSECGEYALDVIEVGNEPDYESATAWLCFPCFKKAWKLVSAATRQKKGAK